MRCLISKHLDFASVTHFAMEQPWIVTLHSNGAESFACSIKAEIPAGRMAAQLKRAASLVS